MKSTFFLIFLLHWFLQSPGQELKTNEGKKAFLYGLPDELLIKASRKNENFYIITDRPWYLPGEEIWFKVHITTNGLPETGSGLLYVDFADSAGRVLMKKILPVDDYGVSYTSFKLPVNLKKGWYSIGVQTQWNRNFNDGFEKLIYINERGASLQKIFFRDSTASEKNTVHFFPEGRNFVAGLQNRFAVKTTVLNGEPVNVQGYIFENKGTDTITVFETTGYGLGEFSLPAVYSHSLSAIIHWPGGAVTRHSLPDMLAEGLTLQASLAGERLYYKIESTPGFDSSAGEIMLVAVMHNEIIYSKIIPAGELRSHTGFIPLYPVPGGIISLKVYTNSRKLLAARDIFHYKEKNVIIEKNVISFDPKGRNEITVVLPDTLTGTYSISISDAELAGKDLLQGYPTDADTEDGEPFTFWKTAKKYGRDINLYLMTGGFEKDTSAKSASVNPFRYSRQSGLNISGKILYEKSGKPVAGRKLNFFPGSSGSGGMLFTAETNKDGHFELENLFLEDSAVVYWNFNEKNKKELIKSKLMLNDTWFDSLTSRPAGIHTKIQEVKDVVNLQTGNVVKHEILEKFYSADSLFDAKSKTLPEVTVYAKQKARIETLDETYASGLFSGKLGSTLTFDLEEEKGHYSSVFSYLQARVPGLRISGSAVYPLLIYRTQFDIAGIRKSNVALYLNEIRVESDMIASIPVSEIAYIKVFRPPFTNQLPVDAPPGSDSVPISMAIAVYIRKGASKIITAPGPSALQSFVVRGFSLPNAFPQPDYSKKDSENIPDKRITLYWNPDLEFIKGRANIVFFNNDFSKKFLVKMEGMNELGEVISFSQVIDK
jgi:hypothetical protein